MSGVFIEPERGPEFGLDIAAIETATGRKVNAIWRNSTWADDPDGGWDIPEELRQFATGPIEGHRRIMSSIEIYFDCGER